MNEEKLLTVKELAQKLNLPSGTIYYWLSRNEIPHLKIGRHHRFSLKITLEWFVEKQFQKTLQKVDVNLYLNSLGSLTIKEKQNKPDENDGARKSLKKTER